MASTEQSYTIKAYPYRKDLTGLSALELSVRTRRQAELQVTVKQEDLVQAIWDFLATIGPKDLWREVGTDEYHLYNEFYTRFFPDYDPSLYEGLLHDHIHGEPQSTICFFGENGKQRLTSGRDYLWVRLNMGWEKKDQGQSIEPVCEYGFWDGKKYIRRSRPENSKPEPGSYFDLSNASEWPWPLLHPERYAALGKLDFLLLAQDTNPLTILLNSPQPYKGLGRQIAQALDEVKKVMLENIGK